MLGVLGRETGCLIRHRLTGSVMSDGRVANHELANGQGLSRAKVFVSDASTTIPHCY